MSAGPSHDAPPSRVRTACTARLVASKRCQATTARLPSSDTAIAGLRASSPAGETYAGGVHVALLLRVVKRMQMVSSSIKMGNS